MDRCDFIPVASISITNSNILEIYYVNQQTGQRSRDLPQETEDDVSDVDLVGLPSASTSGMSAFGYSEASSESENDVGPKITERWVKRLANDGVSYFYLNTLDGRVQWTAPEFDSFHSSHSKTASQPDTSCLSVYSDDSDVQPFDHVPKSRSRQNTDASHRIQWTRRSESAQATVMELTSAERIAKSLQQVLEPPPPDVVGDLSTVTRDAIRAVVDNIHTIGNGFQPEDERNLDQLVYNVILAVRNLLYIAGAPSATSAFSDASRDAKGLSSRQSSLKPSQRKVTATLSRLVLSARAIQYDSGSTLADTLTRIETDSEELERAVMSFVSDAQRFERHEHFKEFPKRLHGIFLTSNIGLGLLGGGTAGSWKGFGYLATDTESDMPSKVLGTEIISEIGLALSRLYDSFDGLTRVLRTTTPNSSRLSLFCIIAMANYFSVSSSSPNVCERNSLADLGFPFTGRRHPHSPTRRYRWYPSRKRFNQRSVFAVCGKCEASRSNTGDGYSSCL